MFPDSSLGLRKALISSASHTFLSLCASPVCSVLCTLLSLWCSYLCKENRTATVSRTATPSSTFSLFSIFQSHQLSVVWHDNSHHKGNHQLCLSLLGETSLDPWAGYCCSRVNSIANIACTPFPSSSFCSHEENPLCLLLNTSLCLAIHGHAKTSDVIAQPHIILSCGHCSSSFGKTYTTSGRSGIPFIKSNELHFDLTPVLLKLCSC